MFALRHIRDKLPLVGAAAAAAAAVAMLTNKAEAAARPSALDANEWRSLKLVHKEQLTSTADPTYLYRFEFPDAKQPAGLPVASCLLTRAPIGSIKDDGTQTMVIRPYTPISKPSEVGHLDLAIKVYPAGKMSQHVNNLKIGETLDFKGPLMKLSLDKIKEHPQIGMVAGGSGLTPMLQVAEEALRQGLPLKMSLIFANVTEAGIIAKDRLDALAAKHPNNFSVYYVVDKSSSATWKGGVGYLSKELLKKHLPAPGPGSMVLVCGPPPMMKAVSGDKLPDKSQGPVTGLLKDMGYDETNVYKF